MLQEQPEMIEINDTTTEEAQGMHDKTIARILKGEVLTHSELSSVITLHYLHKDEDGSLSSQYVRALALAYNAQGRKSWKEIQWTLYQSAELADMSSEEQGYPIREWYTNSVMGYPYYQNRKN